MGLFGWYGALMALGVLLFGYAPKVRTPGVGAILLALGATVFCVRLGHEGPYPFPRGADLAFGSASLLMGLLLIWPAWNQRISSRTPLVTRLLLVATPIVLFGALGATLHEIEEVVVLRTVDERGTVHETRLWVVDYMGSPWVVTGPSAEHVRRLTANPRVEFFRHGVAKCYVATRYEDAETVEAVLAQRAKKYFVHRLALTAGVWRQSKGDIEKMAVAIRLDPCPSKFP